MTRPFLVCLLAALPGLACMPSVEIQPSGGATGDTTSSAAGSGGAGGEQATSAGGGGASASGGSGAGTGSGGAPGPCLEEGPFPASGMTGPAPSKCHCADEVDALLTALAEAARAHHDATGQSCGSAFDVPSIVPGGTYYVPGSAIGQDFAAGDDEAGWACLGLPAPPLIHCRYSYNRGSSPVASMLGAVSTAGGPDDFEVAAAGDADGNGLLSAYSIVGKVDSSGQMVLQPMFTHQTSE